MKARYRYSALVSMLALVFLLLLPGLATAAAADKAMPGKDAPGNIADRWVLWPRPGQEKQLEAAIKTHAAWRHKADEPFSWSTYQPIVGTDLTYYVIRSNNHQWKDFDAEHAWAAKSKAEEAYEQQIGPYVARVEHYFEETDTAHSNLGNIQDYKYFDVTTRQLKPGSRAEMMAALDKIQKSIASEKWPYHYALAWLVGGDGGLRIIVPMKSYADMAEPNPSLHQVLAKALGSQGAADTTLKQFGSSFEGGSDTVYVYRPDLSTQK